MSRSLTFSVTALTLACACFLGTFAANAQDSKDTPPSLQFKMKGVDGSLVDLGKYKGKVVLIVNVASKCGFTPQYKGLQELHKKYAGKGLAILAFPCNNFGGQEPGSEADIKTFCEKKFGVEFTLFSKVHVKGKKKCGLYEFLTSKESNPKFSGEVRWNFEKFLVGRDGKVIGRFRSATLPSATKFIKTIEDALAKK